MKVFSLSLIFAIMIPVSVQAQKKNASYYFSQGAAALDDNKYTTALAHFNECLRIDPYYWEAYALRAAAKEALGDDKGALTDYNIYIDAFPNDADALLGRAVLRYQLSQYVPAREDLLTLLKTPASVTNKILFRQTSEGTDKMFTLQQNNHAELFNYLGLIEMRLKDYRRALHYLDSAVRLGPQDPQNWLNRGILKEHLLDTVSAIADYEKALQLDPSYGLALHNIGVIRRSRGEQAASLKLINDAIMKSPSLAPPYSERAFYYYMHKDFKSALADYNKVIDLNKTDEESWLYRGLTREKLNDPDGAFTDFTEAITLKNDYARAWMARGTLLAKRNRLEEAIEDYSVALLWYPDYTLALYNRALALQKTGKIKEACEDLVRVEELGTTVDKKLKEELCR